MTTYVDRHYWCPTCNDYKGIAEQGVSKEQPDGDYMCFTCQTVLIRFRRVEIEVDERFRDKVREKLRAQGAPV